MATPDVPDRPARADGVETHSQTPTLHDQVEPRLLAATTGSERGEPAVVEQPTGLALEGGVDTQLGGVLYLINVMAHLDLPVCFEAGWALDSQVGSWGVLELLARGLLCSARAPETAVDDALWAVLAQLDGRRPRELPGAAYRRPDSFRLPPSWAGQIDGENDAGYRWAACQGRLRLWSERGYLLLDGPRDRRPPKAQARGELAHYLNADAPVRLSRAAYSRAPLAGLAGSLVAGLNPHLARWLALALPYIRFRLRRALNPAAGEVSDLAELLLLPGRLYVTSTHVDLLLSLDSISLPARMAGLDRNPGWVPDFGRVVLFHFE
jgi:hypothetical protein